MEKPLVLVTGGAGFIGSNLVAMLVEGGQYRVHVLDALTYAGNMENLAWLDGHPLFTFQHGDVTDPGAVRQAYSRSPTYVLHLAAESHVDRSLFDSAAFLHTNVEGTRVMLEGARAAGVRLFVQVSTDEVYGSLGPTGAFTEDSPIRPSSPYSASKAAADLLALAYHHSFGVPVAVTRCSNNYGPLQFPEKLIPLMISNAIEGHPLPVYGDGMQIRDWIHVADHCRGLTRVLEAGAPGMVYNFGGESEKPNLEVVKTILALVGKPESLIRYVADRPGHDRRYAIDISYVRAELGWRPQVSFREGLRDTIAWYQQNRAWWHRIKSGEYRDFYRAQYAGRLGDQARPAGAEPAEDRGGWRPAPADDAPDRTR